MKKQVGIWIRVSTDIQAQGESPEHHEHRARQYAEFRNYDIAEIYHLEAVSGKAVIDHPEAQRMMQDIKQGRITGLIFTKLARLGRNTKELLFLSDFFREYKADMISLEENFDTSTPAGRLFYTLIASMAEWEREEIAARVASSVKVRAKLGKPLGGAAPYGYRWEDGVLLLDDKEAPIRKLVHELFAKEQRKKRVANILNERGYRTRNGSRFSGTTIDRFLRDSIVIGERRTNYTKSLGEGKHWKLKDKDEWITVTAPRLISDELFNTGIEILNAMTNSRGTTRRKSVHLFSGVLECTCGSKMYMRSNSPKYVCQNKNCKNKIEPNIVEEIFHSELKNFLFSDTEIQRHLNDEYKKIEEKKLLLDNIKIEIKQLDNKIQQIFELYHLKQIDVKDFKSHHEPLKQEKEQKEQTIKDLQVEIDRVHMQTLSNDQILHDARNLHTMWNKFSKEEKKAIIEVIVSNILVGKDSIEINLSYIPLKTKQEIEKGNRPSSISCSISYPSYTRENTPFNSINLIDTKKEHNYMDSYSQPT